MTVDLYQVDAFAELMFEGNPAAVVPLQQWPTDRLLLHIAQENNLSETAYVIRKGAGRYDLRWFTPGGEVPLCGHATLATSHVLWTELEEEAEELCFETLSGELRVTRAGDAYRMDFPADPPRIISPPDGLAEALGAAPKAVMAGQYILAIFPEAEDVSNLKPDMKALAALPLDERAGVARMSVVATAPGEGDVDFVSRFFAPQVGIDEDPVTGSAHCILAPYWADRLGRTKLRARQISARGGTLICEVKGDRVLLEGACVTYLRGRIAFPETI